MKLWLLQDAIRYGESALKVGSETVSAKTRLTLAKAYLNSNPFGDFGKAIRCMEPLIRPGIALDEDLHVELCVQMSLASAYDGSTSSLKQALYWCGVVSPDAAPELRANAFWAKGFALFKAKQYSEAVFSLREGLSLVEDSDACVEIRCKLQNVLGNTYLMMEKAYEAEEALNATIQLSRRTGENPLGRAIALGISGRSILKRAAQTGLMKLKRN